MLGDYLTYSDESCTNDHHFMVVGGVLCKSDFSGYFTRRTLEFRGRSPDPMKWEMVRKANLHKYLKLVDEFFVWNDQHAIDFRAVVLDCHRFDHRAHNKGDPELGFNKFVAQHLHSHTRGMGRRARFYSYYAHRDSRHDIAEIQSAANNMARLHYRDDAKRFLVLKHRPYGSQPMFFIADVLIGAVGYATNEKFTAGTAKAELAEVIRQRARVETLSAPTPRDRTHFDIWHMELK